MDQVEFEAVELPEARAYLERWLSTSGPLGEALARARLLLRGSVCVLVPGHTEHDLLRLDEGGLVTKDGRPVPLSGTSRDRLVARLSKHRQALKGAALVVQDPNPSRSDPWLARTRLRLSFVGDTVLYPVVPGDPEALVAETIRRADNYGTIIALTAIADDALHSLIEKESPPGTLDIVAAGTVLVATRAYDMEGWVIWTDGVA